MPDFPDRPAYSFDPGPPPEASRFLKNKALAPSFAWEDVEPEEHAVAFTVAKAMQLDVLEDIRAEVQRALDEGRTLSQFQRDLKPKLAAKGWWGRTEMVDPETGETREVQLGSPRRLRTIYQANLRSARAAGQWDRIQRTKKALPYLVYQTGPSERHRPEHVTKRGLVLPVDDPFWTQWYPPNGWGCKCWVRQVTRAEAERLGIREAPLVEERPWRNPRTGEVRQVPRGIDPAWTGNPGAHRMKRMEEMLAGRLDAADPGLARVIARDIATSWRAERMMAGAAEGTVPVGILSDGLRAALGARTRVVRIRSDVAAKIRERHKEVTGEALLALHEAIESGPVLSSQVDGRSQLLLWVEGTPPLVAVLKYVAGTDELWVSSIYGSGSRYWNRQKRRAGVTEVR
ncbi:MAG: hypothetical protein KDA73_10610 [Rhodobacteraceae bacterium]|nr:hypothetical protein [Paracoccaceae bacterium]